MKITSQRNDGEFVISLFGELDHHSARTAIPKIAAIIEYELPLCLTLDFSGICFMDSSGIALVIGVFKRINAINGTFSVINVPKQSYKVFQAAGLCRLTNITPLEAITAQ